jgi:hypothetical protein
MAALDFSRSVEQDIKIKEDRKFDAVLDYTRDDSVSVDWSASTIKMEIYDKDGGTLIDTLTSSDGITVTTSRLTFNKTFTALQIRAYYFEIFDDTNKEGIQHGKLIIG